MYIRVTTMDRKKSHVLNNLSKLSQISEIREKIEELFEVPVHRQRLFCKGKQLVDGHSLFDYNIGLNEIVQLMPMPETPPSSPKKENSEENNNENDNDGGDDKFEEFEPEDRPSQKEGTSEGDAGGDESEAGTAGATYRLGDIIDCRDLQSGAWYEAKITKVEKSKTETEAEGDDGFDYFILYEGYEEDDPVKIASSKIRPRARTKLPAGDLKVDDMVMVNFNTEEVSERGFWFDGKVTKVTSGKRHPTLICTVYVGKDLVPLDDCKIMFTDEVFAIEKPGTQMNMEDPDSDSPPNRVNKPNCDICRDDPKKKCKDCACCQCGGKNDPEKTIMCDECDNGYHIFCLKPKLDAIPDVDEWFCPLCKNDETEVVRAGEKLKESKKKAKMASATTKSNRDWGRGMATAGRTKICTIVPQNHFGSIPGVEVGMSWKYRVNASESGVHRPHVAGIHGQANVGAFSIVLAGGYEDDQDDGEVFTYTGSGGRDLSGNKRTAEQSSDQKLTACNLAIARNCKATIDSVKGGTAEKWKEGKPVRVLRSEKGKKHSKYAPEEGIRYDGIYKVTKYWRQKGKSGFYVWRYELRRDDPTPAPWTKAGKKRIEEMGYTMQVPEGYWEAQAEKARLEAEKKANKEKEKKRKRSEINEEEDSEEEENCDPQIKSPPAKVKKVAEYKVKPELRKFIDKDDKNKKLWEDTLAHTKEGVQKFMSVVEEAFSCMCCMDIVCKPVTMECGHNVCKSCLARSFKSEVYTCPNCRFDLGKEYKMPVNDSLTSALNNLFPGYETGR